MNRKNRSLSKTACRILSIVFCVTAVLSAVAMLFYLPNTIGHLRSAVSSSDRKNYETLTVRVTDTWEYGDLFSFTGIPEGSDAEVCVVIDEDNYDLVKESGVFDMIYPSVKVTVTVIEDPLHPSGLMLCAELSYFEKTHLPFEIGSANLAARYREGSVDAAVRTVVALVLFVPSVILQRHFALQYRKKRAESAPQAYRPQFKE